MIGPAPTCVLSHVAAEPLPVRGRYDPAMDTVLETPATDVEAQDDDQGELVDLVEEELLVEEVSIDGMCGVY